MKILRKPSELHELREQNRRDGTTVGLVPTMGYLHEGHLSLIKAARAETGLVVMSLFVNPTQFRPGEDLSVYPRDEERDFQMAEKAGVDVIYAPSPDDVYPDGFATKVEVIGLTEVLEGDPASRGPGHFAGVTTIVSKLLNAVDPDIAYFGQKDAQQATVIKRMAEDLDFRARISILPTVRERDGLAMSSRNAYLSPEARERAASIWAALLETERVTGESGLEAADPESEETVLVAVAAPVDGTRLIDNILIEPRKTRSIR